MQGLTMPVVKSEVGLADLRAQMLAAFMLLKLLGISLNQVD